MDDYMSDFYEEGLLREFEHASNPAHPGASSEEDLSDSQLLDAAVVGEQRAAAQPGLSPEEDLSDAQLLDAAVVGEQRAAAARPGPTSTPPPNSADVLFSRLSSLMEWRSAGMLDSPEFKKAKRELGL